MKFFKKIAFLLFLINYLCGLSVFCAEPADSVVPCCYSKDGMELLLGGMGAPLQQKLVELIRNEKEAIRICSKTLTNKDVIEELFNAEKRGVSVKIIVDRSQKNEPNGEEIINLFVANCIPVIVSSQKDIMHNKFALFKSQQTVWTGSANFTFSGLRKNHEVVFICRLQEIFDVFWQNFKFIKKGSDEFFTGQLSGCAVLAYFCKFKDHIIRLIKGETSSITIASFSFGDQDIMSELENALKKGVSVKIIVNGGLLNSELSYLKRKNYFKCLEGYKNFSLIIVETPSSSRIMHHKCMICTSQNKCVLGSANFLSKALNDSNYENYVEISDPDIIKFYEDVFIARATNHTLPEAEYQKAEYQTLYGERYKLLSEAIIFKAITDNNVLCVARYLDGDISWINKPIKDGRLPLGLAIEHNVVIARMLLNAGANVYQRDEDEQQRNAYDIVKAVGVKVGLHRKHLDEERDTFIHKVIKTGDINSLKNYLHSAYEWINQCIYDDMVPLGLAVRYNQLQMAKILIDNGADIYKKDFAGKLPIDYASEQEMKALFTFASEQRQQRMIAIRKRKHQFISEAIEKGDVDSVRIHLSKAAYEWINKPILDGMTPLGLAAKFKQKDIAEVLLEAGASTKVKDSAGKRPICYCQGKDDDAIDMQALLCFAELDEGGGLDAMIAQQDKDMAQWLPVSSAIKTGDIDSVRIHLPNAAKWINKPILDGMTPLGLAAKFKQKDIAEVLVEAGASTKVKDDAGKIPLSYCQGQDDDAMEMMAFLAFAELGEEKAQAAIVAQQEQEQRTAAPQVQTASKPLNINAPSFVWKKK